MAEPSIELGEIIAKPFLAFPIWRFAGDPLRLST
jgi:hypothetical protein